MPHFADEWRLRDPTALRGRNPELENLEGPFQFRALIPNPGFMTALMVPWEEEQENRTDPSQEEHVKGKESMGRTCLIC